MVSHWIIAGMIAVCEQCYWMLKVSYHVVSSVTGCLRCLATVHPTLGDNFCCGVLFPFMWKPISCTWPMELKTLMPLMLLGIITEREH